MADVPAHISDWGATQLARIAPAHGLNPVLLGRSGNTGNTTGQGAGASRFHALTASMYNDGGTAAANSLRMWIGQRLTPVNQPALNATASIGSFTTNTIVRSDSGSFLADGWALYDGLIVTGATTLANNRYAVIQGITPTTLTFAANTFTAEALNAQVELWNVSQIATSTIAVNAGFATNAPALDLFTDNKTFMNSGTDRFLTLSKGYGIFANVLTAMAANTYIDTTLFGGNY